MDHYATLPVPLDVVFAALTDPSRLGDWLPALSRGPASPVPLLGAGATFTLTGGSGEMTAYEPPWLAGYRLFLGSGAVTVRVTCTASAGGTRIHIHQSGHPPLVIDLDRLGRALAAHDPAHLAKEQNP